MTDYKKREIALRDLLYRVLRKWRGILLFALLTAVLAAVWKARPGKASDEVSEAAMASYEASLRAYETDKESYQALIDRTTALLTEKRAYIASSWLMQLDPAHVGKATASVIISAGEGGSASAEQLVDTYAAFCTEGADWTQTADAMGTEPAFVSELISTNPSVSTTAAYAGVGDAPAYSGQAARGTLTVSVVHPDQDTAESILNELLRQLKEEHERLTGVVGNHKFTVAGQSSGYYTDAAIGSRSENLLQELYMLSTNEERLESQLAKLKKPTRPAVSAGFPIKALIRWAVIGFVGGLLLAVLFLMVLLSLRGTVLSAGEMGAVFRIPRLALIPDEKPRTTALDRLVARLDSEQKNSGDPDSRYLFAAIALLSLNPSPASIVLTGSIPGAKLAECADRLKAALLASMDEAVDTHHLPELTLASPLRDNPSSIRLLHEADGVILVEEIERSSYVSVSEEIHIIETSGTALLGSILL